MIAKQYADHVRHVADIYSKALIKLEENGCPAEGVLMHSGIEHYYYRDDRNIAFQPAGHFLHWLHSAQPNQFLLFQANCKPIYYQIVPSDYWYEQDGQSDPLWHEAFDVVRLSSVTDLKANLPTGAFAYCGEQEDLAAELGISNELVNPKTLLNFLDFHRAYKSQYELAQLREANRLALIGHDAARECFLAGGSEYDIHCSYLGACKLLEDETPYTNIVALDEKAAILHYQNKRRVPTGDSQVLLIDAGYRVRGYGSDITRTSARENVHGVFLQLLKGMEELELALVDAVTPGKSYVDIHILALEKLAKLLVDLGICHGSAVQLMERQIPQLFMPHGVGHLLGLQVHDAGGHQQDEAGSIVSPPTHSPMLRNTRIMVKDMVFTIEPGCYFIPLLLDPERNSDRGSLIDWALVDALTPLGGIRIEDNVRVTDDGAENLTRSPNI